MFMLDLIDMGHVEFEHRINLTYLKKAISIER